MKRRPHEGVKEIILIDKSEQNYRFLYDSKEAAQDVGLRLAENYYLDMPTKNSVLGKDTMGPPFCDWNGDRLMHAFGISNPMDYIDAIEAEFPNRFAFRTLFWFEGIQQFAITGSKYTPTLKNSLAQLVRRKQYE